MNLVIFFEHSKDILSIVNKCQTVYNAKVYEILTTKKVVFFDKFFSSYFKKRINVKKCPLNLNEFETIILISPLWFNKIPSPVIQFLEHQTGKIKNIIYYLYNYNKEDHEEEFDKLDKILNLQRQK